MVAKAERAPTLTLPLGAITRSDIGRLLRETEAIEDFLRQAAVRKPGTALTLPRTTQLLEELVAINKLNTLQATDRQRVIAALTRLHNQGPVLHMSFAADPSPLFLQKLITWLRQHIHPQLLLHIGLQPNQAAGCVVRTNNKVFDFSLRQRFQDKRELLETLLRPAEQTRTPQEPAA